MGTEWVWSSDRFAWEWNRYRPKLGGGHYDDGEEPALKPDFIPGDGSMHAVLPAQNGDPDYLSELTSALKPNWAALSKAAGGDAALYGHINQLYSELYDPDVTAVGITGFSIGDADAANSALNEFSQFLLAKENPANSPANAILDDIQDIGDLAGQVPGAGEIVDLANATVSAFRGNLGDAALRAGQAAPGLGNVLGAGKVAGRAKALARADFVLENKGLFGQLGKAGGLSGKRLEAVMSAAGESSLGGKLKILREAGFNAAQRRHLIENFIVCFVAGTKVETKDGLKNIEDIKVGDYVLSKNEDTGETAYKRVVKTFTSSPTETVRLEYKDERGGVLELEGTPEHPFWSVDEQDWVSMGDLNVGERLQTPTGTIVRVLSKRAKHHDAGIQVYNFEVEDWHTYFVSGDVGGRCPLLVHNLCAGKHHMWQRALGNMLPYGDKVLTGLNAADHTAVHVALAKFLRGKTKNVGGTIVDMFPRKGNPGSTVISNFSRVERGAAFDQFYKTYLGGAYYSAFSAEVAKARAAGLLK